MTTLTLLGDRKNQQCTDTPIYQLHEPLSVKQAYQLWRYTRSFRHFLKSIFFISWGFKLFFLLQQKKSPPPLNTYFDGLIRVIEEYHLIDYQTRKIKVSHFALQVASTDLSAKNKSEIALIELILKEALLTELGDYVSDHDFVRIKFIANPTLQPQQIFIQFGEGVYLPATDELPIGELTFKTDTGHISPIYLSGYPEKPVAAYYWGQKGLILGGNDSQVMAQVASLMQEPKQRFYLDLNIQEISKTKSTTPIKSHFGINKITNGDIHQTNFELWHLTNKIGNLSVLIGDKKSRLKQQCPTMPRLKLTTILLPKNKANVMTQWQLMLDKNGRLPLCAQAICHQLNCDHFNYFTHHQLNTDNKYLITPLHQTLTGLSALTLSRPKGYLASLTHQAGFGWVELVDQEILFQSITGLSASDEAVIYPMSWLASATMAFKNKKLLGWFSRKERLRGNLASAETDGLQLKLTNNVGNFYYKNIGTRDILWQNEDESKQQWIKPNETGRLYHLDKLTLGLCIFQYEQQD